ncbi:MAG: hypothetical protein ACYDAC_05240 [Candidatus Dormibacteria bacterium]
MDAERTPAEEYLFWRDEILQVMYWMAGEGLADAVRPSDIVTFVGGDSAEISVIMRRVCEEAFLETTRDGSYRLTELGRDAGKRSFALEFEGLTAQGHGECGPDCWCHQSAARAAQCATERLSRVYGA